MQIYKNSVIVTTLISIVSFIASFVLKFYFAGKEAGFWYDISMGIFSGAILTLITSIIGYRVERRKVLEGFWSYTHKILNQINMYEDSMTVDQKVNFFMDFHDTDRIEWHTYYGEISFLFDWKQKNRLYIYHSIYKPLYDLCNRISPHYWNFKWYKDGNGNGRNEKAMQRYINEIEPLIIERKDYKIPTEIDDEGKIISEMSGSSVCNKLFGDIMKELNNRYYEIMYGKRRSKKEDAKQENE